MNDGFEWRDGGLVVTLAEVHESDIQSNAWDLGSQLFGRPKLGQCVVPLLPPHVDDSEIHVRAYGLGICREDLAKGSFGGIEAVVSQCLLARKVGGPD